jgi:DNA-binding transcriptional ArsR family regulator
MSAVVKVPAEAGHGSGWFHSFATPTGRCAGSSKTCGATSKTITPGPATRCSPRNAARATEHQLSWRTTSTKGQSSRADRRPELLVALGNETLSRSELVTRTGLSDQTIRRWLKIMRDEGSVDIVGSSLERRDVRYRRTYQDLLFHSEGTARD